MCSTKDDVISNLPNAAIALPSVWSNSWHYAVEGLQLEGLTASSLFGWKAKFHLSHNFIFFQQASQVILEADEAASQVSRNITEIDEQM